MVQRLGKAIAKYSGISFTHPDHALGPAVSQPFLEQLQAVLAGTTTPRRRQPWSRRQPSARRAPSSSERRTPPLDVRVG